MMPGPGGGPPTLPGNQSLPRCFFRDAQSATFGLFQRPSRLCLGRDDFWLLRPTRCQISSTGLRRLRLKTPFFDPR